MECGVGGGGRTRLGSLMSSASRPLGKVTRRYRRASRSGLGMSSVTCIVAGADGGADGLRSGKKESGREGSGRAAFKKWQKKCSAARSRIFFPTSA
jgi:hypothetical protein